MSFSTTTSMRASRARASAAALKLRDEWLHQANSIMCNLGIKITTLTQDIGPLAGLTVFVVWDSDKGVLHFDSMTKLEVWLDARWCALTGED